MPNGNVLQILEEAIEHYRPTGKFAEIRGEQLREKKATVVPEMRAEVVGRGLSGTTIGAAIPAAFEQQVAKPWRTETEMLRSARLMEAILAKAGFQERVSAREQREKLERDRMAMQQRMAYPEGRVPGTAQAGIGGYPEWFKQAQAKLAAGESLLGGPGAPTIGGATQHLQYPTPDFGGGADFGAGAIDPTIGAEMYTPEGSGMYLGEEGTLSPEQVQFGQAEPGYKSQSVPQQISYLRVKKRTRGLSAGEERYLQSLTA